MSMNSEMRFEEALKRLASEEPMIKAQGAGVSTQECKTRVLYAKRVIETANRIDAIEQGVIAEMEAQETHAVKTTERIVGEKPVDNSH